MKGVDMFRTLPVIAAVLLFGLAPALADIGPKPTTSGSTPAAMGEDMPGIEVEMTEETVDLLLTRAGEKEDRLEVRAEFLMKNHGETATFETGFPIGRFRNFEAFSIEIDGKPVDFDVVSRKQGRAREYWYAWQATYPGHAVSRHVVKYAVKVARRSVSPSYAGYVLRTGAPWKGPIGKATVTLRCGEGLSFDQFFRYKPNAGGRREADRVVWSFTNFEPTKDHDITFYYDDRILEDEIAKAREEAKSVWSSRPSVVAFLGCRPGLDLRDRLNPEEFPEYIEAVAALIEGLEERGDRLVLPKSDAKGDRSYVSSPHNILHWIDGTTKIAEKYPESDRAKELLGTFIRIGEKFLAGKLYAGDVQLELPWRGRTDTEEVRAKRDASVRKRRARIEGWLEKAKQVLSAE